MIFSLIFSISVRLNGNVILKEKANCFKFNNFFGLCSNWRHAFFKRIIWIKSFIDLLILLLSPFFFVLFFSCPFLFPILPSFSPLSVLYMKHIWCIINSEKEKGRKEKYWFFSFCLIRNLWARVQMKSTLLEQYFLLFLSQMLENKS